MRLIWKLLGFSAFTALSASLLVVLVPSMGEGQDNLKQVAVLSTASLNGEVSPCG